MVRNRSPQQQIPARNVSIFPLKSNPLCQTLFLTQPTELMRVKTSCQDLGFCTTAFNGNALGKDHPVQLEMQTIGVQRKQHRTSSSSTGVVLGYLTGTLGSWLVCSSPGLPFSRFLKWRLYFLFFFFPVIRNFTWLPQFFKHDG